MILRLRHQAVLALVLRSCVSIRREEGRKGGREGEKGKGRGREGGGEKEGWKREER